MTYHFLYKTTNMINGKYYIGIHSTDNLNDDYLGSGIRLNRAINKYGIEHFNREILMFFGSREEAYEAEKLAVELNELSYNLVHGGHGGGNKGIPMSEEAKLKISESKKNGYHHYRGKNLPESTITKLSESLSGDRNPAFIGYYITPYGRFDSATKAAAESHTTKANLKKRCRHNNNDIIVCKYYLRLHPDAQGKTWNEYGWKFEPSRPKRS